MKQFIKRIFGIEKLEKAKAEALAAAKYAKLQEDEAIRAAEIAKMTPKEVADLKKEPWVAVLDTHVNKDNIRNGFFELDWNSYFIEELKKAGYGFDGDPDEEIVDRWFRDLAGNMFAQEGIDISSRTAGFIDVKRITPDKSEVS
ncbi:hypothetical protein UFOVP181_300 [uncultured Caudovirales phage]|uniref:Uncharacterized protein n=1 Tax=uncultured Caudovirales phage TaxID=2100421 RepID=A0A6J5KTW8_9CAUD|nr:hypothetical protein UFOVP57_339 [uncultured Caudovirales phage]CAB5209057.1 hypothetical protein UFOVP181_300 [uncultured Caudovirales phage]